MVAAKAIGLENLPESIGERWSQALILHSEAVARVREFMETEQKVFGSIDPESVGEMRALGYLSMTINPSQCDSLMQSGFVESIAPNMKFKVDLL